MKFAQKSVSSEKLSLSISTGFFLQDIGEGSVACMISLEADEGASDLAPVVKFTWNAVTDHFLQHIGTDEVALLEGALDSATEAVSKMLDNTDDWESGLELNIAIISNLHGQNLKIGLIGDIDVLLLRESENDPRKLEAAHISKVMVENDVRTSSVEMLDSDRLVLSVGIPGAEISSLSSLRDTFNTGLATPGSYITVLSASGKYLSFLDMGDTVAEDDGKEVEPVTKTPVERENHYETHTVVLGDELPQGGIENPQGIDGAETKPTAIGERGSAGKANMGDMKKDIAGAVNGIKGRTQTVGRHVRNLGQSEYVRIIYAKGKAIVSKLVTVLLEFLKKVLGRYERRRWYRKLLATTSKYMYSQRLKKRGTGMRIGDYSRIHKRNKRIVQALFVLIIFVIGYYIFAGIKEKKQINAYNTSIQTQISAIEEKLNQSQESISISRDNSAKILKDARTEYEGLVLDGEKANEQTKNMYKQAAEHMQKIDDLLNHRIAINENDGLTLWKDTKVEFGAESSPSDMVIYDKPDGGELLLVTDAGKSVVYYASLPGGELQVIPDSDKLLKEPLSIDYGNNGIYVYDRANGMLRSTEKDGVFSSWTQINGLDASAFGKPSKAVLAIFTANDWIYLLNPEEGTIFKAQGTNGIYGLPYKFFSDDILHSATDLFADLNIYILTQGRGMGIHRYISNYSTGGLAESPVSLTGTDEGLTDLVAGHTGGESDSKFYVFDDTSKSLFAIEKPVESGEDLRHPGVMVVRDEYLYRGDKDGVFDGIKDIAVSADEAYAYLLDGTKIWQIRLHD